METSALKTLVLAELCQNPPTWQERRRCHQNCWTDHCLLNTCLRMSIRRKSKLSQHYLQGGFWGRECSHIIGIRSLFAATSCSWSLWPWFDIVSWGLDIETWGSFSWASRARRFVSVKRLISCSFSLNQSWFFLFVKTRMESLIRNCPIWVPVLFHRLRVDWLGN